MASSAAQDLDGRQSRTARSRRAICEACLDLVQEGILQPSADQVAERAGLSRRSIFNHFTDLSELYDSVFEAGMERCLPLLEEIDEELPVAERVAELVRVRSTFHEATAAFTRALTAQTLVGSAADQALRFSRDALAMQHRDVERLFAGELPALPTDDRVDVLEAISASLAPLHWEYLRWRRGMPVPRARAVLQRSISALLRDAGVEGQGSPATSTRRSRTG